MKIGKNTEQLVRQAMVLAYVEGWRRGDEPIPRDSEIEEMVYESAKSFKDLYPKLSKVERNRE